MQRDWLVKAAPPEGVEKSERVPEKRQKPRWEWKQPIAMFHLKKFMLVYGHVGTTTTHTHTCKWSKSDRRRLKKEYLNRKVYRGGKKENSRMQLCANQRRSLTHEPNSTDLTP